MTPFEKDYLSFCLKKISDLLSNKAALQEATKSYTQGNFQHARYCSDKRITGASSWSSLEQLQLSAAVFVADADTAKQYCKAPEDTKLIVSANQILLNQYIPLITKNTTPDNRLLSVKQNIIKELELLKEKQETVGRNPYSLFAVVAGVAALGLATLLTQPGKPR